MAKAWGEGMAQAGGFKGKSGIIQQLTSVWLSGQKLDSSLFITGKYVSQRNTPQ